MQLFDKLLLERVVKQFNQVEVDSEEMEEVYESFKNISDIEGVKPYLIVMKVMGWGTEQNTNAVEELRKVVELKDETEGLYYDLLLKINPNDVCAKNKLEELICSGYRDKYLKENSNIGFLCNEKYLSDKRILKSMIFREARKKIAGGYRHVVGIKCDGTLISTKPTSDFGQCDVGEWTDIVAVEAGIFHTVGLKKDGTVVATKWMGGEKKESKVQYFGQCEVQDWCDIVAIAAGSRHTVGLKRDGTLIATEIFDDEKNWTDIIAVAAIGGQKTIGLKKDGTVLMAGKNDYGRCEVNDWRNIVSISAGTAHVVGLKADGTVVATMCRNREDSECGQCNVGEWTDIVAVEAGHFHTVGLKKDGTVVSTKIESKGEEILKEITDVSDWQDIIAIAAGEDYTVGLRCDGTLIGTGCYFYRKEVSEVCDWKLF